MTENGPAPTHEKLRLGELLRQEGLITEEALRKALVILKAQGRRLGDVLVSEGLASADELLAVLSKELDVPSVNLEKVYGDPETINLIPREKAYELKAIPLFLVENQLTVALGDPKDLIKIDELAFLTGKQIMPVLAFESDINRRLEEYYGEIEADALGAEIEFQTPAGHAIDSSIDLADDSDGSPAVRLVNLILARALQERASDIHFEPQRGGMVVRFRIDGRLQQKGYSIPASSAPAVVSRLKILGQCDISERRAPQDGKVAVRFKRRQVDIRVSTYPTILGEKVVLRLLDKERQNLDLDNIGMSAPVKLRWKELLRRKEGIMLVTGPTGSGKSSTLFASLRHLNEPDVNIVTLEDPVEYELAGISQGQVNERAGFTFAAGLRSILRQDPDIILIGEIRDGETAQVAVRAAMTGHLVLATLHTNDAPSAVTRLVDMGLTRGLVSATLIGSLAQRLVRRVCTECATEVEPDAEERELLAPWLGQGVPFIDGTGCTQCLDIGYRGRLGVQELLSVDRELQALIARDASIETVVSEAAQKGYTRLWQDGLSKVREGVTTLRELARTITPEI